MKPHYVVLKDLVLGKALGGQSGADLVRERLSSGRPCMVARFGAVEIKGLLFPRMPVVVQHLMRAQVFRTMTVNAGFFPASDAMLARFSEQMFKDMRELDVLGSWRVEERVLQSHLAGVDRVELNCLEPYHAAQPWSVVLAGRKVLVVHPFDRTIEHQYHHHREHLFANPDVLPLFRSLQTVKAVQTIAGNPSPHADWFEALDAMKQAIDALDYEVAILGCGAYGFPLAAHIKRQGRQAVHLGGATQILFGIRGRRWDRYPVINRLVNEHWVRPSPDDVPVGVDRVEGGCYW
jgi:hypothetical protein